ncbi:MAG: cupin [Burkholderiales bacterium 68-12]|uniref:cupin domain-containing protein n=1 Tax=Comamonas granuli TaxID=290309 RepID=UPI0005AA3476|nr:cupin domain-containing protein [Comamonas granuli]OJX35682.1 MAG: cupin [Burkholderiales bacterium 68-12]
MAQAHTPSGQVVRLRPLGAQIGQTSSSAILKAGQLEAMRIVLPAGKSLPQHQTPGEATVLCLEGEVELHNAQGTQTMQAGDFVHLQARAPHALRALQDASLLVTVCLLPG